MAVLCEKVPIQITERKRERGEGGRGGERGRREERVCVNESEICTHPNILYHLIKS